MRYIILFILLSQLAFGQAAVDRKKVNIITIMLDDIGVRASEFATSVDSVDANGNTIWSAAFSHPNMDSNFQGRAEKYTRHYVSPICTPSRISYMTGELPHKSFQQFGSIDKDSRTHAQFLRECGYEVGILGKWQLGNVNVSGVLPYTSATTGDIPPANQADKPAVLGYEHIPMMNQYQSAPGHIDQQYYNCFGFFDQAGNEKCIAGEYGPDTRFNALVDFVEEHKNHCDPFHIEWRMSLAHGDWEPSPFHPDYPATNVNSLGYYPSMVEYADHLLKQVLDYVDSTPELAQGMGTVVMITSDNGAPYDQRVIYRDTEDHNGGKRFSTEHGTHVPMYTYYVGPHNAVNNGADNDQIVSMVDFYSTYADLAMLDIPDRDGISFADNILSVCPEVEDRNCHLDYYNMFWDSLNDNERNGTNFNSFATDGVYWLDSYGRFYNVTNDITNSNPITPTSTAEIAAFNKLSSELATIPGAQNYSGLFHGSQSNMPQALKVSESGKLEILDLLDGN